MNLLLTSIGKRIQLIEHLRTRFRVIGADASEQNPGKYFVDKFCLIPRCAQEGYKTRILEICREESIDLLIPLYEPEFPYLNEIRDELEKIGTKLILGDTRVIKICDDKRESAAFFERHGIPAPETISLERLEAMREEEIPYPLIIKPLDGMGSEGVFRIRNRRELEFFKDYVENPVIQTCAEGTEYTMDVLCGSDGKTVYLVPRVRLEVRSGEVSKSKVRLHPLVIEETEKLIRALCSEGSVCGPLTIQCFLSEDETAVSFIEINPRFGGGVPLSFEAGADYAAALEKMCRGESPEGFESQQIKELRMMRFDRAVYEE